MVHEDAFSQLHARLETAEFKVGAKLPLAFFSLLCVRGISVVFHQTAFTKGMIECTIFC